MFKNNTRTNTSSLARGFTLVEMLVAVSLFAIIAVINAGTFVMLIKVQERARAFANLQDNLRFALDSMGREIMVGSGYRCVSATMDPPLPDIPPPPSGTVNDACNDQGFMYTNSAGQKVAYRLRNGTMEKWVEGTSAYAFFTNPRVVISNLRFYANGAAPNNNIQPKVVIILQASVPDPRTGQSIFMNLETVASQRKIDS